ILGNGDQNFVVADIAAFLEIGAEQATHEPGLRLFAKASGPMDEAMRIERVRRNLDGIEVEGDANRRASLLEAVMGGVDAFLAAEFLQHVSLAILSGRRNGRIELKRTPAEGD